MKRPCREVGIARECEKFSDKGTEDRGTEWEDCSVIVLN